MLLHIVLIVNALSANDFRRLIPSCQYQTLGSTVLIVI